MRAEQKTAYGTRMEKMYKRLAKHALDPDNKAEYLAREKDWHTYAEKWQKYHEKQLEKALVSGIIIEDKLKLLNTSDTADMIEFSKLGKINTEPLKDEFGDLQTDDIIITNERVEHIKQHHPQDYELFDKYGKEAVSAPDEVIVDPKHAGTVFMIKHLPDTNLNVIVRLSLANDKTGLKNSVMTFYRIREANLKKLRDKGKILYKHE